MNQYQSSASLYDSHANPYNLAPVTGSLPTRLNQGGADTFKLGPFRNPYLDWHQVNLGRTVANDDWHPPPREKKIPQ